MKKQTAVEYLEKICYDRGYNLMSDYFNQAKEMEKEQSQNYAIFAIRCDRTEMRILEFNDYIKLQENEKNDFNRQNHH